MSEANQTSPIVSIVVPAYNCAPHIVKCLDSIRRQKIRGEFEIIVVNDFSTDSTVDVVTSYIQGKAGITLINHAENVKQGAARNTGLRAAKGKYVFFLDSDDWLGDGGLGHMIEIAEAKSAEVVACGMQRVFGDGRTEPYHAWEFESSSLEKNVQLFSECKIGAPAANKLFSREFLLTNHLFFVERYFHEDILFTAQVTLKCRRYISIENNYYNYFWNDKSTLNRAPTKLHLLSYCFLLREMGKYIDQLSQLMKLDLQVLKNLTLNYGSAEVLPKIQKYGEYHGQKALEADLFECAGQIFGGHGYYLSNMMLLVLNTKQTLPTYTD